MSTPQPLAATHPLDPQTIERVLLHGDLRQLTPQQKVSYYGRICDSLGLNPLTQPFAYIVLNGKEVLYAKREATEQLRFLHNISVEIKSRELIDTCYVVTATATMPNGRRDESTGVVAIEHSKGEVRANLLMKAETKAKRRVTLSICGLGMLDETEVASIPDAKPIAVDVTTGEMLDEPPKPEGYEDWALDMEATADHGLLALQAAWKQAPVAFRKAMPQAVRDQLKAKALQVQP
jgi:hypothetical protein